MSNTKSRRQFLKQAISLGGGVFLMSSPFSLLSASNAISKSEQKYKALICLDLDGGNDGTNTIIPIKTKQGTYEQYAEIRKDLALSQDALLEIKPKKGKGDLYGLHPELPALQSLFNKGQVAVLANVGARVSNIGTVGSPPKRASHSNQRQLWHGLNPENMATNKQGWLGLMSELPTFTYSHAHEMASVSGNNLWQTGTTNTPFIMKEDGPIAFTKDSDTAMEEVMKSLEEDAQLGNHTLTKEYAQSNENAAIRSNAMVTNLYSEDIDEAIKSLEKKYDKNPSLYPGHPDFEATLPFPNTRLGKGFETILRSILFHYKNTTTNRQSFYIRRGGFDFHANHLERQSSLLKEVNDAIEAFQSALEQLNSNFAGVDILKQVTTFTMSDFGRTTTENGTGTAHGWGNHHFIIGKSVKGKKIYGRMPEMRLGGQGMLADKGLLKPSTSIEQYAATLAMWFGVSKEDLPQILPHVQLFEGTRDIDKTLPSEDRNAAKKLFKERAKAYEMALGIDLGFMKNK